VNFLVIKHVECEGLGLWEECCREAGITVEVAELHYGAPLPPLHRFQAVISLGGPMNVYEEEMYPFLRAEDAFIQEALTRGVPFLGFCLGGQLLAKAAGGRVTQNPVKEIGWLGVELDPQGQRDPLFAGLPERFTVFQWHGDTFSLPRGAVRLATSPACLNQAFSLGFGSVAYALQFHLEVMPLMIAEWVRAYADELSALGGLVHVDRMLAEAAARCGEMNTLSRRVFKNFCRLVQLRFAGVGSVPAEATHPAARSGAKRKSLTVEQAWEQYRRLLAKGTLRCGVTCPLDRIGHCTGGCW
jgi:GMP synthase-like glutamine amidotransferase